MRVIVFADHEIGYCIVKDLIKNKTYPNITVAAVVTTRDNDIKWWPSLRPLCLECNIPIYTYEDDPLIFKKIPSADLSFLLSWKYLIPQELISHSKFGVINLHYSLLPDLRGVYPVNWAIIEGRIKTGISYHIVNEMIDAGPVLISKEVSISMEDTARSLQLRLDRVAHDSFSRLVEIIETSWNKELEKPINNKEQYRSKKDFLDSNEINLNATYKAGDLINFLRGKSFIETSPTCFFIDPETDEKIFLHLTLKRKSKMEKE